jgi:diadenosine tetraphosphate (Ap4A) HIT family hydrolase
VLPSFGALLEGWLLVVSSRHVTSLAELQVDEWDAFIALRDQAATLVGAEYGSWIMFEHGAAGSLRQAGCGVDHAHSHIVPLDIDLRTSIRYVRDMVGDFNWSRSESQPQLIPGHDYIWLHDRTGQWISSRPAIPGQVVRRAIAARLGVEVWDWKADLRLDLALATTNRLTT